MRSEERRELDKAVEIAREAGLRSSYIQAISRRGSAANEWGDFNLLFRDLEEAYKEARQMRSLGVAEFALFCIVDALFDLGAIEEACKKWEVFKKEFPVPIELRQIARRFHIEYAIQAHNKDYQGAAEAHRNSAKIFSELEDAAYLGRARFQLIKMEVLGHLRPIVDIVSDFNRTATEAANVQTPITHYARREAAYLLAAAGGRPIPAPEENYDTLACPNSYYRQHLSVAKIHWLDAAGKKAEATKLRELYRAERNRMMESIPARYHASFLAHPFYRVPDPPGE
jgi:tetratricopeptide (TPR) repeat protein